jgi:hypothetical protein
VVLLLKVPSFRESSHFGQEVMWLEQMHREVKELGMNHLLNMIFQFHSYQTANQ